MASGTSSTSASVVVVVEWLLSYFVDSLRATTKKKRILRKKDFFFIIFFITILILTHKPKHHRRLRENICPTTSLRLGISSSWNRKFSPSLKSTKIWLCSHSHYVFFNLYIQWNSVITNSSGPAIFVRYNRGLLIIEFVLTECSLITEFVITEFHCNLYE